MELFEAYEGQSIYDILRESLDDEMDIMRAMHAYEMKSIYMEAAEKIDEDELEDEIEAELEALMADEEVVTEGQNRDAKKINKEHIKEAAQLAKEAKKMMKAGNYSGAKANYTKAAKSMRDAAKEIDKMDQSWGSAVLGSWATSIKSTAKGILLAIPTLGIGMLYQEVKFIIDGLEMIVNVVNKVRAGKELSANDFNMYVKRLKDSAEKIAKDYDKLAKECGKKGSVKESFEPESDVLMEAAGDVIERIKNAAKAFFEKVKGWFKDVIANITNNAKAYKTFVTKYKSTLESLKDLKMTPSGYKAYIYLFSNKYEFKDVQYHEPLDKLIDDAVKGDQQSIDELKRISNMSDVDIRHDILVRNNIKFDDKELTADRFEFNVIFSHRHFELETINHGQLMDMVDFLDNGYSNVINYFKTGTKEFNDSYAKFDKDFKAIIAKSKSDGASEEVVKYLNMYWNVIKRNKTIHLQFFNIIKDMSRDYAGICKKAIYQAIKESNKK